MSAKDHSEACVNSRYGIKIWPFVSVALLSIILFSCSPGESELASIEQTTENQQSDDDSTSGESTAPTPTHEMAPTGTPTIKTQATVVPTQTPMPAETVYPPAVAVEKDLVYAVESIKNDSYDRKLDLYAPAEPGSWPVFLFLPGAGEGKGSYGFLAEDIAEDGVMVFVVDYPKTLPLMAIRDRGAGHRQMAETIACAVRFARSTAMESGKETTPVALSGFSLGGGPGSHVALAGDSVEQLWEDFADATGGPPGQVECTAEEGSTHIDAFIGIAGAYDAFVGYDGKWGREFMQENDPDLWELFFGAVGKNPELKVRLLHSESDYTIPYDNSVGFYDLLDEAGYDVQLITFDGGHNVPNELLTATIMDVFGDNE